MAHAQAGGGKSRKSDPQIVGEAAHAVLQELVETKPEESAHFVLYTRSNELPHARLGVVVAKRFAPRAVTRNTIKRVTRELFRQTGERSCSWARR